MRTLWTVSVAVMVLASPALAQDMTGAAVTDPPAPVADGLVTLTGTYENVGSADANACIMEYAVGITAATFTDDGLTAMLDSAEGTETGGNTLCYGYYPSMCNQTRLVWGNGEGCVDNMNPIPAGSSGSFTVDLPIVEPGGQPVIPMQGLDTGKVVIVEPESLRNTWSVNMPQWTNYTELWGNAGAYNLVSQGALCDNGGDSCEDLEACFGARLWQVPPFEAEIVIAEDGSADHTACSAITNPDDVAGKIALIRRTGCSFFDKAVNVQDAGAAGMIMVNFSAAGSEICGGEAAADPAECTITMGADDGVGYLVELPFVQMGNRQGEEIFTAIGNGETVIAQMGAVPGDTADVYAWAFEDDDPNIDNDLTVTRVPIDLVEAPTDVLSFVPAAAVAPGAEGSFFQTDIEINNKGDGEATVTFLWLPRGQDNSEPTAADPIIIGPGESLQYPNALNAIFGAQPPAVGAVAMLVDSPDVIGMSRTYNIPPTEQAGTFGQALPAVPFGDLIMTGDTQRIIFMSENADFRANLGCVNGTNMAMVVDIELYDADGNLLETVPMSLAPWSNKQLNQLFEDYAPVNGYADISTATEDAAFYCYGSVLDNLTSDPTSVLPQVPSDTTTFIAAAAVASGAEGSFFQTDVDLNNTGTGDLTYSFLWLPRGQDNSNPTASDEFTLAAGSGVRIENVLTDIFGAQPNALGALAISASTADLIAMTRTYNIPPEEVAGTFGQAIPGVPMNMMIPAGETKRIIFLNENDDFRANLGCVNGVPEEVTVTIDMFDSDGNALDTRFMVLPPWSNKQINQIFDDFAPVNGYVDVSHDGADAYVYCYGSVLDNVTSDPTTVLPQ